MKNVLLNVAFKKNVLLNVANGQQELRHAAYARQEQWRATLDAEMRRREPIMRALETLVNPPPFRAASRVRNAAPWRVTADTAR